MSARIVITYNHGHRAWMAVSDDPHQGSIGGPADMVLAQVREWMGVETSDERTHADIAYERACEQLKRDNQELRALVARYRDALEAAQGEAYLGALDGDDTPTPLAACHSVMSICVEALRGVGVGDETP